jgi:hypothetical protein
MLFVVDQDLEESFRQTEGLATNFVVDPTTSLRENGHPVTIDRTRAQHGDMGQPRQQFLSMSRSMNKHGGSTRVQQTYV